MKELDYELALVKARELSGAAVVLVNELFPGIRRELETELHLRHGALSAA